MVRNRLKEAELELLHDEEKLLTQGLTSQFYREDKPSKWLKAAKKSEEVLPTPRLASRHKFCTQCGKKHEPREGQPLVEWCKVRRCGECIEGQQKSVDSRGGKYCMNCGTFFSIRKLIRRGVDRVHGLGTWAACGCK
jgi:hypothetical protein